mgnify:CR=1 FL=1
MDPCAPERAGCTRQGIDQWLRLEMGQIKISGWDGLQVTSLRHPGRITPRLGVLDDKILRGGVLHVVGRLCRDRHVGGRRSNAKRWIDLCAVEWRGDLRTVSR